MGSRPWDRDRWKVGRDDRASIEGLPLQLMIIGLIASLGTAIVVGWISSIEAPRYIGDININPNNIILTDPDDDGHYTDVLEELTIRILDTADKPVAGAVVIIEGASIDNEHHRVHGVTDADGMLILRDIHIKISDNRISVIYVTVRGDGLENEYRSELLVFPE